MKDRKIYSAIAALTLISAATASTASTGSISFNGSVEETTCTVTGLNQTQSFPTIASAELQPLAAYAAPSQIPMTISLANCPSSLARGLMTVTFTPAVGHPNRMGLGDTSMRGAAVIMGTKISDNGNTAGLINTGAIQNIELSGGAGSTTLYPTLMRATNGVTGGSTVVPGAFTATAQLTMAYE